MVCAMTEGFAGRLRALMAGRDLSQHALARKVPCSTAHVSLLASGKRQPSAQMARLIDDILGAGGELAALAPHPALWRPPVPGGEFTPDDEERLRLAVARPSRVDAQVPASLATILAGQRELEDRIGSTPMLAPVAAQLRAVEALVTDARGPVRAAVLDVAAQWAQFCGWLHANTDHPAQAAGWFDRTLEWGTETGETALISTALSYKAHLAWIGGDVGPTIGLSAAAQRGDGIPAGMLAYCAGLEARGHAMLGEAAAVGRRLDNAMRHADRAAGHPEDERAWTYWYTPAFFGVQRGLAWLYLGAADPVYNRKAIGALAAGVDALDATARASEWGANYLLYLARAHLQDGDADQACAMAGQAAGHARRLGSAALLGMLRRLHTRIARQWPDVPAVAEMGEALRRAGVYRGAERPARGRSEQRKTTPDDRVCQHRRR